MVGGADDIRVAVLEDYLLEHALYSLGVPNKLLIFPGEGHSLGQESVARQDQSARRAEVAGEVRRRGGFQLIAIHLKCHPEARGPLRAEGLVDLSSAGMTPASA